jgi:hypothetical protein
MQDAGVIQSLLNWRGFAALLVAKRASHKGLENGWRIANGACWHAVPKPGSQDRGLDFFYVVWKTPGCKTRAALQSSPIKAGAGVVLAARRDVLMPCDVLNRVFQSNGGQQGAQGFVLGWLKAIAFHSLQFYSD